MVVINQTFPYPIKQMKLCLFMLIIKRQYPRVDNLQTFFFPLSFEDIMSVITAQAAFGEGCSIGL